MLGVSIAPGLSALTRILRPFGSMVHVRASERTAALAALYMSCALSLMTPATELVRIMLLLSRNSGSAFCRMKIRPRTSTSKVLS